MTTMDERHLSYNIIIIDSVLTVLLNHLPLSLDSLSMSLTSIANIPSTPNDS